MMTFGIVLLADLDRVLIFIFSTDLVLLLLRRRGEVGGSISGEVAPASFLDLLVNMVNLKNIIASINSNSKIHKH